MQSDDDAFGRGLYDCSIGENIHEVIEREDGFISVSKGPGIYFSEFDDWIPAEQEAMSYAFGQDLDIGCGAGRHALYLQDNGLDVLGLDSSPLALKVSQ
jgi:SAM-dependent methyltransferase